jgi:ferrochelatase
MLASLGESTIKNSNGRIFAGAVSIFAEHRMIMATQHSGVILMNLGSPDSTSVKDVHRYLIEFLMDERVIDYPWLVRKLLVEGIIVPLRAKKSAEAYRSIWTKEGSPLIVISKELRSALSAQVEQPVALAMRYGKPGIQEAFDAVLQHDPGLKQVLAIPLYPHYAMSSFETAVEHARAVYHRHTYPFELDFLRPYYQEDPYVEALSETIRPYLDRPFDQLLFSYHGIPERHIRKSDVTGNHCLRSSDCCSVLSQASPYCYRHQVLATTTQVTRRLGIGPQRFSVSFQSRIGKGWLEPFTDRRLESLPKEGVKKLLIVCPSFVSDCLETLEEIAIRGRASFLQAGGESFDMIPCLNVQPLWVQAITGWVNAYQSGDRGMLLASTT